MCLYYMCNMWNELKIKHGTLITISLIIFVFGDFKIEGGNCVQIRFKFMGIDVTY